MDGGISDLYLNFNVLNNEVFEMGDEGWKAKKDNGNWEFREFDIFRQGKLKIGFGKFFVQAKKIVKN